MPDFQLLIFLTVLFLFCKSPSISIAQPLDFNLPTFSYDSFSTLTLSGSSGLARGALQVTFDSGRSDERKYYNMGRVLYSKPLRIWDSAYDYAASFNTSFAISISPSENSGDDNRSSGGGMAFIMAGGGPSATYCLGDCSEEWLGMFNSQPVNSSSMVAIEFDTFKNTFDPDDNHVGIDLNNSIASFANASVDPTSLDLSNGNTSVWVDYDGRAKTLHVYLAPGDKGDIKPVLSTLSVEHLDLRDYLQEEILFGFSGSTGSYFETHCVLRWEFNTTEALPVPAGSKASGLVIGLTSTAAAVAALALMATALLVTHRAGLKGAERKWPDLTYGPRKFTYKELETATDNFSSENMLGKGGFGTVYKGNVRPNNTPVAVKRVCPKSSQGEQEFIAEVTTIGRLRHKNLLPLLGWYHDRKGQNLLLVYDYMPNGSLDKWLFHTDQDDTQACLNWPLRYKIVHGLARALLYLHEDWEHVVVHRDVKSSNVMLDFDYNARLGDFGLARLMTDQDDGEATNMIAGTVGYMAPEYVQTGIVTPESDVYSFGVVALEVACGKQPYSKETGFLAHVVWRLQAEGKLLCAADTRLEGAYDEDEMKRLLTVGLACCNPDPRDRPLMREVLQSISKDGPLPRLADSNVMPRYAEKRPPWISSAGFQYTSRSAFPWTSETRLLISSDFSTASSSWNAAATQNMVVAAAAR